MGGFGEHAVVVDHGLVVDSEVLQTQQEDAAYRTGGYLGVISIEGAPFGGMVRRVECLEVELLALWWLSK